MQKTLTDTTSMNYTRLGRTGLTVSVAGLGCGGHSRLGQASGASEAQSISVVKAAIDMGINFIDTAAVYGTEEIVGRSLGNMREKVVISSKEQIVSKGSSPLEGEVISGEALKTRVEASLKRLNTDYIDILHLHGVMPDQYLQCRQNLVPALYDLKTQGKIRFLGITERFIYDTSHKMLSKALTDDFWDVVMIGFNLLNSSAKRKILPKCRSNEIAALCMFAVRRALSQPDALRTLIKQLSDNKIVNAAEFDPDNPLGFLISEGGAESVVDGAYRFCRHVEGLNVILTGTGNIGHLKQNIASINRGPLQPSCLHKLAALFGHIDSVSGE